jgi:hypothetical protein
MIADIYELYFGLDDLPLVYEDWYLFSYTSGTCCRNDSGPVTKYVGHF